MRVVNRGKYGSMSNELSITYRLVKPHLSSNLTLTAIISLI